MAMLLLRSKCGSRSHLQVLRLSKFVMAFSKCTNSSLSKDYMLLQAEASIEDIVRSGQAQNDDFMIVPIVGPTMPVEVVVQ